MGGWAAGAYCGRAYDSVVPTLNNLVRDNTDLGEADIDWLHQLVGDWQLLADLSFADLVLWVQVADGWLSVAHVRPTTGPTVFFDDVVGERVPTGRRPQLEHALATTRICRDPAPEWCKDVPAHEEVIPVVRAGRIVGVLSRMTSRSTLRTPSRLELTYLAGADSLAAMVVEGAFPVDGSATGSRRGAPRVGDGMLRLDGEGVVTYASPNAVSAYHRLGYDRELAGASLAEVTTGLLRSRGPVDEGLPLVLTGKAPWRSDVDGNGTVLSLRAIPLIVSGVRVGALVLLRDVTELRRRERELISKDATIREIHHRVKNNLQTVAALLRMQSRRLDDGPGRAALDEAGRRVGAIALVHETLSTSFDETVLFDDVATRALAALVVAAIPEGTTAIRRTGHFGRLRAEDATALSLVLTELVQNAIEHGLAAGGGEITIDAQRLAATGEGERSGDGAPDELRVIVSDDGTGMAPDRKSAPSGLGSQIVRSLVAELGGIITWSPLEGGGTQVTMTLRPRPLVA